MPPTFTAFFDANVFFGVRLRSLTMEVAQLGLFRARWSADVHREWIEAVVRRRPDLAPGQLQPIASMMDEAVPDALVSDYESLISGFDLPDPDDRHILAAAIVGRADVIVTFNARHFPSEVLRPYAIHIKNPDDFFLEADSIEPGAVAEAAARDLAHYKKPPLTLQAYTDDLRKAGVPKLADYLWQSRTLLRHH